FEAGSESVQLVFPIRGRFVDDHALGQRFPFFFVSSNHFLDEISRGINRQVWRFSILRLVPFKFTSAQYKPFTLIIESLSKTCAQSRSSTHRTIERHPYI